jgi:hypothetical protein
MTEDYGIGLLFMYVCVCVCVCVSPKFFHFYVVCLMSEEDMEYNFMFYEVRAVSRLLMRPPSCVCVCVLVYVSHTLFGFPRGSCSIKGKRAVRYFHNFLLAYLTYFEK